MAVSFQNIMDFATVNRENYEQLKRQVQRGTVLPFVGAGLSACVYPGWKKVLEIIAGDVMDLSAKEAVLKLLADEYMSRHEDALEQAAAYLEDIWTKSVFDNKLYHLFSPEKLETPEVKEILCREAAAVLPGLFPQGVVLTTNYDHVLEEVYRTYGRGIHACDVLHQERLNRRLREMSSDSLLIKLHGDVEEAATSIILNRESYDKAYQDGSPLIAALHKCYGTKSMLFLGCSLAHDRTMDELQKTLEPGSIHFAVFPCKNDGTALQNAVRHMGKKNILPILYPEGQYVCVRLILEQLLMESDPDQYRQLPVRLRECGSGSESLAERLAPETRAAAFCGRDIEYGKLLDFCLERKDSFLWWAVTGDGGAGKSRLAYELSIRMRKKGWNVFFLKRYDDYLSFDPSSMQNGRNTLYILDRVIGYEEQIGNWMEERHRQSRGTIVRILLVERENRNFSQNGWKEQILYGAEMPGILEECCYDRQMLELQPMEENDIRRLIVSYGDLCGEEQAAADEIMDQLKKIDPDRMRPLYAILLVEVWKREELHKMDTRDKLLEYMWKAESARYQTYFLNQNRGRPVEARACAKAFLALKLAATLQNGLEWDRIQENFAGEWEEIADKEYARKMIISNLEESGEEGITALQPDLMADYYVLREAAGNRDIFERIFVKCWDRNSIECFTRIASVISDFPEKLDFVKQVLDMPLNINTAQQINLYGAMLAEYSLLKKEISGIQQAAEKLTELMKKGQENVGLRYPLAACVTGLCREMDSFEEKWKYLTILLELGYIRRTKENSTLDMMLANMIGRCLVSCYKISLSESEFQKVERERKRLLSEIRYLNPLYFYMLGVLFGKALLTFYLDQKSIRTDVLVSLLKDLLVKIDKDEGVRLIYIQIYMLGLMFQLDGQTNGKKAKRIWYQIDELYDKETVRLIEKVKKAEYFLPAVYAAWSFREKSLELILRNLYATNEKMVETIVGEESQINAAASINSYYMLAMGLFVAKANDESISGLLDKLKERYRNAAESRKADEAAFYSRGLMLVYDKYARIVFDGEMQISDELRELFQALEKELNFMEDTCSSEQIHKDWIEVLTTSTYMEQDLKVVRKKVEIIGAEYEAGKKREDNDIGKLRHQYSMALNNLCRKSDKRSECEKIICKQWELYNESGSGAQEKEMILWELAKTVNNTVTTVDSLEECRRYSKEIQRILSFDEVQSEEIKEGILLEYGKSLVNSFSKISPDMTERRKEYLNELESLYLDAEKRDSALKEQFRTRWILGLNNAAATCAKEDEAWEYLEKKEKIKS